MSDGGEARFSHGTSTRSELVRVHLGAAALSFVLADGTQEVWNYEEIFAEPALGRRDREGLLHPRGNPTETLWVSDPVLLNEIRRRAPHITTGSRTRMWIGIAAGILLLIGGGYGLVQVTGAKPARMVAKQLPVSARVNLGQQLVSSLVRRHGKCVAADGQKALNALVARFEPYRLSDELPWKVSVVGWPIVNAFAAPGGSIVLTRGLLNKARSPDEVAGVLAHEIGHAQALHPEAGIVRALGVSIVIEFMTGGSGGALSNLGANVVLMNSTRNAEREADEAAIVLMRKEKISPNGLRDFFARLQASRGRRKSAVSSSKNEDDDQAAKPTDEAPARSKRSRQALGNVLSDVFSTHPGTSERIARIERVAPYDSAPSLSMAQWKALKGICSQTEGKVERRIPKVKSGS